jgi:hypothetical protein
LITKIDDLAVGARLRSQLRERRLPCQSPTARERDPVIDDAHGRGRYRRADRQSRASQRDFDRPRSLSPSEK